MPHICVVEDAVEYKTREEWLNNAKQLKSTRGLRVEEDPEKYPCLAIRRGIIRDYYGPDYMSYHFIYDYITVTDEQTDLRHLEKLISG